MDERAWLVRIYRMSGPTAQETTRALLAGIDSLTIQANRSGRDHFLVVECSGDEQAECVHRFITSADPDAGLLHTSTGSEEPVRHREQKPEPLPT